MSDRWQDDPNSRVPGLLTEIDRHRLELETAERDASDRDRPSFEVYDADARLAGSRKGLDAAVMMAFSDRDPPPDGDILAAAHIDAAHLEALRSRFRSTPPDR